jgi:hypothetical protein
MASAFNFNDIQQMPVALTFLDGASPANPALASNIQVSVDNPSIFTVAGPAVDGNLVASAQAILTAVGPLGTANLTVTAIASDGSTITGTAAFTVVAGPAKSIQIVPGTPGPIVAAPAAPAV